jgi:hypothetical protein
MDARAETPVPKTRAYLPVEDLPQRREQPGMTADEVSRLKKELIGERNRQAIKANRDQR